MTRPDWIHTISGYAPEGDIWAAYDPREPHETRPIGWGATEAEAIDDLIAQLEDME
jgi:hypothetical protein